MKALVVAALGLAALAAATPARAHTMSDGHLTLVADGDRLVGTIDLAVRDLHDAFGLDLAGDGAIDGRDVTARRDAITGYVIDHLTITSNDGPCGLTAGDLGVVERPDGAHVAVALTAGCPGPATVVTVDYRLLYELDAQHRGLIRIGDGAAIARHGGGPVTITVRSSRLARLATAMPGGALALTLAGAVLALGLATLLLRRTSRLPLAIVVAISAVAATPVAWSICRLASW